MAGVRRARLAAVALVACLLSGAPARAVDLIGTWHVLVHYKDASTAHPERERWEDRIWEFSLEGTRLVWTDYPIVVFADPSGRFENLSGNRAARVLGFWEPNAAQLANIEEGLEINPRGARTKTLRGGPSRGWSTARSGGGGYQSARFITYTETWSIEGLPERPVFTFDDVMGSTATESFEGRTRYTTGSVERGGDLLRGRYDRDGARVGTFRMTRSGATSVVEGSGQTQGERVVESFFGAAGEALYRGELPDGADEETARAAIAAGEFGEEDREALRRAFEDAFVARFQGGSATGDREIRVRARSLARQAEALFVEEGRSIAEIQEMLRRGEIRP